MEFKQLRAFVTLAETLNFSRASELLYISQSTLSKQIVALEEYLGTQLLIRDTHSVVLTDEGACFLKYAREILSLSALAEHSIRDYVPDRNTESLLIGYDAGIDSTVELTSIIANASVNFQKMHPNAVVKTFNYSIDQLADTLRQGTIDLAISIQDDKLIAPFKSSDYNSICLRSNRFVAAVKAVPGVDYTALSLYEVLSEYKTVNIPPYQAAYSNMGMLFDKIGIYPFIHFNTSFVDTLIKVVRGECFAVIPETQFDKLYVDGIAKIPIPGSILNGDMRLLWKKESNNRFIQEFIRLCHDC